MIQNESTDSNRGNVRLFRGDAYVTMQITVRGHARLSALLCIGLYRDVWIAAIASSRTSLATLTGVMCNTSQCELRLLRVNSRMLNVIRIGTYYTLLPLESPDSFWIAMAFCAFSR